MSDAPLEAGIPLPAEGAPMQPAAAAPVGGPALPGVAMTRRGRAA